MGTQNTQTLMSGSGHGVSHYIHECMCECIVCFMKKGKKEQQELRTSTTTSQNYVYELNLTLLMIEDRNRPFNLAGKLNINFALFTVSHCSDHFGGNRCQESRLP